MEISFIHLSLKDRLNMRVTAAQIEYFKEFQKASWKQRRNNLASEPQSIQLIRDKISEHIVAITTNKAVAKNLDDLCDYLGQDINGFSYVEVFNESRDEESEKISQAVFLAEIAIPLAAFLGKIQFSKSVRHPSTLGTDVHIEYEEDEEDEVKAIQNKLAEIKANLTQDVGYKNKISVSISLLNSWESWFYEAEDKKQIKNKYRSVNASRQKLIGHLEELHNSWIVPEHIGLLSSRIEKISSEAKNFFQLYIEAKNSQEKTIKILNVYDYIFEATIKFTEAAKRYQQMVSAKSLAENAQQIGELQSQIKELEETNERLREEKREIEESYEELEEEKRQVEEARKQLETEKVALQADKQNIDENLEEINTVFAGLDGILKGLEEDKAGYFSSAHKAKACKAATRLKAQVVAEYIENKENWQSSNAYKAVQSFKRMNEGYSSGNDTKAKLATVKTCKKEIAKNQSFMYKFGKAVSFVLGAIIGGIIGAALGSGVTVSTLGADLGSATGAGMLGGGIGGAALAGGFFGYAWQATKNGQAKREVAEDDLLHHLKQATKRPAKATA
jgi:hypothetical protein